MTPWELALAACLYLFASGRYALAGDFGMCVTMAAYAVANFGLMNAGK